MSYTIESYVKNTAQIRFLSSPKLSDVEDASGYRALLRENFVKIGELAKENREILDTLVYPVLLAEEGIPDEKLKEMGELADMLLNDLELENLDPGILLMLIEKLLEKAIEAHDDESIIKWVDEEIVACYTMQNSQRRISVRPELADAFRIRGAKAADINFTYLDKDKFSRLSDESKEKVLVNARYFCVLYDGDTGNDESNALIFSQLKRALSLSKDEFYREQLPGYDWDYHNLRTLEYIGMLVEFHNLRGMTKEQCLEIAELQEEMYDIWEACKDRFEGMMDPGEIRLNILRARFEAGEVARDEYVRKLISMYESRDKESFEIRDVYLNLTAPLEYILLLDKKNVSEPQSRQLEDIFHNTISFLHRTHDTGSLSFQLEYAFDILENFIEVPGVITFEEMCISCLAALHPPTYVHTMMVGEITRCLCRHLLRNRPDLFEDMRREMKLEDDEILDFAWHAAICHDFGKLSIIDTIMIYGRRILDDEFALIKQHPDMGAMMMVKYPSTRKYANVARGHHKWYDNSRGYPENLDITKLPERVIIALVTCADCLDAATDTVGRSYNTGKTVEDYTKELIEGSGTRYAPYLGELFSNSEVAEDITFLLKQGRADNYLDTYVLLNEVQAKKRIEEGKK